METGPLEPAVPMPMSVDTSAANPGAGPAVWGLSTLLITFGSTRKTGVVWSVGRVVQAVQGPDEPHGRAPSSPWGAAPATPAIRRAVPAPLPGHRSIAP